MSITRHHYVMLASVLADCTPRSYASGPSKIHKATSEQHRVTVNAIADALAEDNKAFDRERFLKAAGVQS